MKTIEIKLYQFDELSEEAKSHAIEKLYDINVNFNWWEATYEDASNINLKLDGFDLDRNKHCTGKVIYSAMDTAKLIIDNHGEQCPTHILAKDFISECEKFEEIEDLEEKFENDLLKEYADILQNESEYLQGDTAIIETIKANEYDFRESGELHG